MKNPSYPEYSYRAAKTRDNGSFGKAESLRHRVLQASQNQDRLTKVLCEGRQDSVFGLPRRKTSRFSGHAEVPLSTRTEHRRGAFGVLMKRSRSLSLILMGSLVLGGSGCGSDNADEGMYTFTSINECVTSGLFSEAECAELAKNAMAQTPRFSSKEECERAFGKDACADAPNAPVVSNAGGAVAGGTNSTTVRPYSGSSWMPMMMGFMAGRFMSGGSMMQGSQGLYRDPDQDRQRQASGSGSSSGFGRSFRSASGEVVRPDATGRVANPSPKITQSMAHTAKPVLGRSGGGSRGGFFSGGGSHSFGGGP